MKKFIVIMLILILAIALGVVAFKYPGYMLLAVGPWRIESTLWVGLLCLLFGILALQISWRLLRATCRLGQRWQHWTQQRKQQQSQALSKQAMCDLAEGRFEQAEKKWLKAAPHSHTPLVAYCQAAKAAQQQSAFDRRDHHLAQAQKGIPDARLAIGLYQAQLQHEAACYQEAIATLKQLAQSSPNHPQLLRQLLACYQQQQDHDAITELLPTLAKTKSHDKQALIKLTSHNMQHRLQQLIHHGDPTTVRACWQKMTKQDQSYTTNTVNYCRFLMDTGDHGEAESLLSRQLKKHWDPALLGCYGALAPPHASKALQHAEPWLKNHPSDADLLQCLGQLAATLTLWGKAKEYYQQSLQLQASPDKHFALAAIYQKCNETSKAQEHMSAGLAQWQAHDTDHR